MFVDIDKLKAPLKVEVMLFPFKKGEEKITPEVCMDVLKSTNYQRSIKDMLNCILALPVDEQAQFKDVVLSTFDNREQPNDVLVLGKKLAVSGGYEEELAPLAVGMRGGYGITSHAVAEKWLIGEDRFSDGMGGNIWFCGEKVQFDGCDLSSVNKLKFQTGAVVTMRGVINLPSDLDLSMCSRVNFNDCDFGSVENLKLGNGAEVMMRNVKNLPSDLDVSMCSRVDFNDCDLWSVKELKFRENAEVMLRNVKNLPEDLDVSMCPNIVLAGCDLTSVKKLEFSEGAEVNLWSSRNLPADLDVSMCSRVSLSGCDLSPVEKLKFGEGAGVSLAEAKNLPADLDFSMCSQLDLSGSDLSNVEHIAFKNKQQMERSEVKIPKNLNDKVIFADKINKDGSVDNSDNRSEFLNIINTFINSNR